MLYTSIEKLKAQLGIPESDTTRDAQLTAALRAVCEAIDNATGRSFAPATGVATIRTVRARVQHTDEGQVLLVDDIGSAIGLTAQAGRAGGSFSPVTGALELYPLEDVERGWAATGVLLSGGTWPTGPGARIQMGGDWGWPATPAVVEQASLLQGSRIFKRKDSPEGILGSAEWGALRVSRVDPDVEAMLAPLRREIALVG